MTEKRQGVAAFLLLVFLAVVSTAAADSSPQQRFERAEALSRQLQAVDPSVSSPAWNGVVEAFYEVARRDPHSPLAAEALWRAAAIAGKRAAGGDEAAAALELQVYAELAGNHPASPHAPEALLRLAARAEAEEGTRAADLYARLLQRYPGTPQAALARSRLSSGATAVPLVARRLPEPDGSAADPETGMASGSSLSRDSSSSTTAPGPAGLSGVRHYSDRAHTRVVIDLDRPVSYEAGKAGSPPRIYFDLLGARLPDSLPGARFVGGEYHLPVEGDAVRRVRLAENRPGVVRVVVDLAADSRYSLFTLDHPEMPFRVVVDVPAPRIADQLAKARRPPDPEGGSVARQLQLAVRRIVIDPGHGGQDPGAIGRTGLTEKEVTLRLAKLLAESFAGSGYEVYLTRQDDRTVSLRERTGLANRLGADLFVSLHVNASRNRRLRGFETYFLNLATDPTAAETAARENAVAEAGLGNLDAVLERIVKDTNKRESQQLARTIQDSMVMHVSRRYDQVQDLGVKQAPFYVLVGAQMPSVLVEASFLSNVEEERRLRDPEYLRLIAESLAVGIRSYVEGRKMAVSP